MTTLQHVTFKGDTKGLEEALKRLNKVFASTNDKIKSISSATVTMNKSSTDMKAAMSGVTAEGRKFSAVLERVTNKGKVVGDKFRVIKIQQESIEEATKRANKQLEQQTRLLAQERAANTRRRRTSVARGFEQEQIARIPTTASDSRKIKIQEAISATSRLIERGEFTRAQFNRVGRAIEKDFGAAFTGAEAKAAKAFRKMNASFDTTGDIGKKAAKGILISWQAIQRVFIVHSLHLFATRMIHSFTEMIKLSSELNIKISEIATIATGAAFSFEQWEHQIRAVSSSFGFQAADVAAAAYEALSNQVANGIEVFGFLNEAAIFARTTNSSLADSVDLLSSVLNVYADDGINAARASEILFKTIDLGRVRADEMKDTLGSITVVAAQLGITFEEVAASLTTLTIQGVKYDRAATLIRNITLKLIKPTEQMRDLFNEWGVSSGEAAIATFGFAGVLERLQSEAVEGGAERIGELAGRIRAIVGLTGLTAPSAFDKFNKALGEISKTSAEAFAEASAVVTGPEAVGFRLEKQIEQIQNTLQSRLGGPILQSIVSTLERFGGAEGILNSALNVTESVARNIQIVARPLASIFEAIGGLAPLLRLVTPLLTTMAVRWLVLRTNVVLFNGKLLTTNVSLRRMSTIFLALGKRGLTSFVNFLTRAVTGLNVFTNKARMAATTMSTMQGAARSLRISIAGLTAGLTFGISLLIEFASAASIARDRLIDTAAEAATAASDNSFKLASDLINEQTRGFLEQEKAIRDNVLPAIAELRSGLVNVDNEKAIKELFEQLEEPLSLNTLDEIVNKIDELRAKSNTLFSLGKTDESEKAFEQILEIADEGSKMFSKVADAVADIEKRLRGFDTDSISGNQLFQRVDELENQAISLFDEGNIEDSLSLFKEIDEILKRIYDRQKDFRERAEKLGVEFTTPLGQQPREALNRRRAIFASADASPVDEARERAVRDRLALFQENQRQSELNKEIADSFTDITTQQTNWKKTVDDTNQAYRETDTQLNSLLSTLDRALSNREFAQGFRQAPLSNIIDTVSAGVTNRATNSNAGIARETERVEKLVIGIQLAREELNRLEDQGFTADSEGIREVEQRIANQSLQLSQAVELLANQRFPGSQPGVTESIANLDVFIDKLKEVARASAQLQSQREDLILGAPQIDRNFESNLQNRIQGFTPLLQALPERNNNAGTQERRVDDITVGDINITVEGTSSEIELYRRISTQLQRDIRRGVLQIRGN